VPPVSFAPTYEKSYTTYTVPEEGPGTLIAPVPPSQFPQWYYQNHFLQQQQRDAAAQLAQHNNVDRGTDTADLDTPTRKVAKGTVATQKAPLVVDGTSPPKKSVPTAGNKTSNVAIGSLSDRATQAKSRRHGHPNRQVGDGENPGASSLNQPPESLPTTSAFEFKSSGLPEWPSPEKRRGLDADREGYRVPNNTPSEDSRGGVATMSLSVVDPHELCQRLISGIFQDKVAERRAADEARAREETEAAESLLALSRATEAMTAEVHAAFAEVDEFIAELTRAPAARPDASPEEATDDEPATDEAGGITSAPDDDKELSEAKTEEERSGLPSAGAPDWPHDWWLTPKKGDSAKSIPSEEADEDTQELDSEYEAAAKRAVALLGFDTSSVKEDRDSKDVASVRSASLASISGPRDLTDLQLAAERVKSTKAHAAVRERAKVIVPVVSVVPAVPSLPSQGFLTENHASKEPGRSQTVSPFPPAEQESSRPVVQLRGDLHDPLTGNVGVAGQQKKAPDPRRASDVRVALPSLSLLAGNQATTTTVKEASSERKTQAKATPKVVQSEVESGKAEEKQADTPKQDKSLSAEAFSVPWPQPAREVIDTYPTNRAANYKATRMVNPPPGFHDRQPVAIPCTPPQSPITHPSTSATTRAINYFTHTQKLLELLTTGEPVPRLHGVIPEQNPKSQETERLVQMPNASAPNMGSNQQPGSSYLSQQRLDGNWPDFQNMAVGNMRKPADLSQAGDNEPSSSKEPTGNPSETGPHATATYEQRNTQLDPRTENNSEHPLSESEMARIEAIKRDWAGCVGKSDDVAVERLPWERMRQYYPNGPPRHMGRFVPIPDNWQETNPLRQNPTMAGQGMAPEEQLRYQANVDRIFYSGSRFWNMSMQEAIKDVNLRHIYACYLSDLGVSRADFNREYGRYVDVFNNTYEPGPYRAMTVEELKQVPPNEITEPMITMAFRNLLLYRAEAALPDGQKTFRSMFVTDHPAIKPKPGPFGAIGEERAKGKGKGKEGGGT
jgi:hypothetical protein